MEHIRRQGFWRLRHPTNNHIFYGNTTPWYSSLRPPDSEWRNSIITLPSAFLCYKDSKIGYFFCLPRTNDPPLSQSQSPPQWLKGVEIPLRYSSVAPSTLKTQESRLGAHSPTQALARSFAPRSIPGAAPTTQLYGACGGDAKAWHFIFAMKY